MEAKHCVLYDFWSGCSKFPFEKGTEIVNLPEAGSNRFSGCSKFPFEKGTEINVIRDKARDHITVVVNSPSRRGLKLQTVGGYGLMPESL